MEFHVRAAHSVVAHRVLRVRRHVALASVHHRTTVFNVPRKHPSSMVVVSLSKKMEFAQELME